jgi:hypothetical protein
VFGSFWSCYGYQVVPLYDRYCGVQPLFYPQKYNLALAVSFCYSGNDEVGAFEREENELRVQTDAVIALRPRYNRILARL